MEPKVIAVKVGGTVTRIEDLPLEAVDVIAKKCGVSWIDVVAAPMQDLIIAQMVLEAVCTFTDQEMPTGLSTRKLADHFTTVPDDVPVDPAEVFGDNTPDPFESSGSET